ncbi:MAG: hypothetical protein JWL59_4373 [Chthoniobacteraceae bacterium]|nr:hypothetical protein [Chthoniobacteraceae bacterium]
MANVVCRHVGMHSPLRVKRVTGSSSWPGYTGPIAATVYDDAGRGTLLPLLCGLSDTGFTRANVKATLSQTDPVENRRVGQALAETYLVHHLECHFRWPDGRDTGTVRVDPLFPAHEPTRTTARALPSNPARAQRGTRILSVSC